MEQSLYSSSWYRVAHLQPRLRGHAVIHRQRFRGQLWYVLQDRTSGRFHRFSPAAHFVISLLDGKRSVQEIWDQACTALGDDVLTQDDMIKLLAQLHSSDVLTGDVPPDLDEMSERASKQRRRKLTMSFINPLAIRIPILDPDAFLTATMPMVRKLFGWFGLTLFVSVVGYALLLAGVHWSELTTNITDRVLATESLLLLLVTYPFVKALHELGHGYAVKRWGGEVHEIGIMFLVFMPVPYVDASNASAFQEKWRRALVGSAGILVEMFLAALAMFVWVDVEEGLVRAFAFNVMIIGGVSTVFFNGNPLLRFDGYYILTDLIEIPNLGSRSNKYLGYLIQRYLFGIKDAESTVTARGEAPWMFCYSIASFCYRLFIVTVIVSFVATKFFVVGVLMAVWSVFLMLVLPLSKQVWFLFTSPVLNRCRRRAMMATAGVLAACAAVLMLVPLPYSTVAEGIVWAPGEVTVHAGAEGMVVEVLVAPNSHVEKGTPLIRMEDPLLDAHVRILAARVSELELRYADTGVTDQVEAKIVREQLRHAQADLELSRQRQRDLLVTSLSDGQFILPRASDQPGRFVRKGEVLGYIANLKDVVVRVIVNEDAAELVRDRIKRVDIRFVDRMSETVPAVIEREVPELSDTLPSMALSTVGGGEVMIDPTDVNKVKVLVKLLHLEVRPVETRPAIALGERAYVRFTHGAEPLAGRMYRAVRQVFLRRFSV
ncbi:MAG: peptidase M50 [Pseudomonadota bacterium]